MKPTHDASTLLTIALEKILFEKIEKERVEKIGFSMRKREQEMIALLPPMDPLPPSIKRINQPFT